jgi:predicted enzyme related to lactoylglutathione lyase
MPNVSISQMILFVGDMAGAVRFYRDVLGLTVSYPQGIADYSKEMWVEFDGGACSLALHGGSQEKPGAEHQIVFHVENLEETRSAILEAGFEIDEIRLLEDGAPAAKGVGPEGHRFSIRPADIASD